MYAVTVLLVVLLLPFPCLSEDNSSSTMKSLSQRFISYSLIDSELV